MTSCFVQIKVTNWLQVDLGTDVLSLREVEIYGVSIPEPSGNTMLALTGPGLLRRKRT